MLFVVYMFEDKMNGFQQQQHLRLAVVNDPPFSIRSNDTSNGTISWDGYVIHVIQMILQRLSETTNTTYTYEFIQNRENLYDKRANKSWQGIVGDVANNDADIAVAILTINEKRRRDFLFTYPIWFDRFALIVSEKANLSMWQSDWFADVQPSFSASALAVFALALVCAFALFFAEVVIEQRSTADGDDGENSDSIFSFTRALKTFVVTSEMLVRLITLRDTPWEPASRSGRTVMCLWAAFCGIVTAAYAAQLFSIITVNRVWNAPFNDFSSMRRAGFQIVAQNLSANQYMLEGLQLGDETERKILRENLEPRRRAIWPRSREESMKLFTSGAKVAVLSSEWQARLYQANECDIRIVPFRYHAADLAAANETTTTTSGFQQEFCAFLLRKSDWKLVRDMNIAIEQLWQAGLLEGLQQQLDKWNQDVLGLHGCQKTSHYASQVQHQQGMALTLDLYTATFSLLAQGVGIAMLLFAVEIISACACALLNNFDVNRKSSTLKKSEKNIEQDLLAKTKMAWQ